MQDGQGEQAKEGTESGVDLPKVGGCVEGTWNEDDGGVHFGLPADNYCVRGDPPNSQRMQAGGAQEGGNTMPLVVGTANGLRRPRCNWIRRISPGLCILSFIWGGVRWVCTRRWPVWALV